MPVCQVGEDRLVQAAGPDSVGIADTACIYYTPHTREQLAGQTRPHSAPRNKESEMLSEHRTCAE